MHRCASLLSHLSPGRANCTASAQPTSAREGDGVARNAALTALELRTLGTGLQRPECVVPTSNGDIWVSHYAGGGVTRIRANGSQQHVLAKGLKSGEEVHTNGFSLSPTGSIFIANLTPPGGVWRLNPQSGACVPFVMVAEGIALRSVNFVHVDAKGRVWITISTQLNPRSQAYRPDVADGFIVMVPCHTMSQVEAEKAAVVVARDRGYTNEAKVRTEGNREDGFADFLYVNETFARKTTRFRITDTGGLTEERMIAQYGAGTFPDGLDFDVEGGVWVTSILSNRLIRLMESLMPGEGEWIQVLVLEDCDEAHLAQAERAFQRGGLGRPHLDNIPTTLGSLSSIALLPASRDKHEPIAYLGNLLDDCIYAWQAPVHGAAVASWEWNVPEANVG